MGRSSTATAAVRQGLELAIPHEMSTPEWAETYRGVGRGARQGKWLNETAPYLVGVMEAADDPMVRKIVFQAPRQIGKSSVAENIIGKRIHQSPTEIAYVAEKEDKARAWTQEAFDSMVRATPALQGLIYKADEDNNQKVKRFPGGSLHILHATSPAEGSSRPYQIIVFDEKAAYKPTKEGDIVKIIEGSTKTYDGEELIIIPSTPRRCACGPDETCGDISHDYEAGDQREFYVPCPHCDEFQTLKFGGKDTAFGLKWDPETPEVPYYVCEHCAVVIEEFEKDDMLLKGYWRASKPFNGTASFKLNQLYSPFVHWGKMVSDWYEAHTSPAKLEVFTNTVLGEVWKPVAAIPWEEMNWKLEIYPVEVPEGVLMLTAGVDVQKDRIECEVVGWGKGHESWSIDYKIFYGSPGLEITTEEQYDTDAEPLMNIWEELATYLERSFIGATTYAHRIQCAAIDEGYLPHIVRKFCRKYISRRWYPVKGVGGHAVPILSRAAKPKYGPKLPIFNVGTNAAKDEVFLSLQETRPGPGYCHFPAREPYINEAHQKQLCSERAVTHSRSGITYRVYEKVSPNVRNEALDVRVYATAARYIFPPVYEAVARRRLQHVEVADAPAVVNEQQTTNDEQPDPPDNVTPFPGKRRRGSLTKNNPFAGYKP